MWIENKYCSVAQQDVWRPKWYKETLCYSYQSKEWHWTVAEREKFALSSYGMRFHLDEKGNCATTWRLQQLWCRKSSLWLHTGCKVRRIATSWRCQMQSRWRWMLTCALNIKNSSHLWSVECCKLKSCWAKKRVRCRGKLQLNSVRRTLSTAQQKLLGRSLMRKSV